MDLCSSQYWHFIFLLDLKKDLNWLIAKINYSDLTCCCKCKTNDWFSLHFEMTPYGILLWKWMSFSYWNYSFKAVPNVCCQRHGFASFIDAEYVPANLCTLEWNEAMPFLMGNKLHVCLNVRTSERAHLNTGDTASAFNFVEEGAEKIPRTTNELHACCLPHFNYYLCAHPTKKIKKTNERLHRSWMESVWCAVVYFSFIAYTLHISVAFFSSFIPSWSWSLNVCVFISFSRTLIFTMCTCACAMCMGLLMITHSRAVQHSTKQNNALPWYSKCVMLNCTYVQNCFDNNHDHDEDDEEN